MKLLLMLLIGTITLSSCSKQEEPDRDAAASIVEEILALEEENDVIEETTAPEEIDEVDSLKIGLNEIFVNESYQIGSDTICYSEDRVLTINDDKYNINNEDECVVSLAYLCEDGTYWLLLRTYLASECGSITPVYVDTQHNVKIFDSVDCIVTELEITDETLVLYHNAKLFGTHVYKETYNLSPTAVTLADDLKTFINIVPGSGIGQLTLSTPLTVYDFTTDSATTMEVGDELYPIGFYPSTRRFIVEKDGVQYYFIYDEIIDDTMSVTVNGVAEEDIFKYLY